MHPVSRPLCWWPAVLHVGMDNGSAVFWSACGHAVEGRWIDHQRVIGSGVHWTLGSHSLGHNHGLLKISGLLYLSSFEPVGYVLLETSDVLVQGLCLG